MCEHFAEVSDCLKGLKMKKFIVLMGVLLLGACSSKFAYNNLDWVVYWYLDDYIELNDAQEKTFDRYLQGWLRWHKEQELKQYHTQLTELRSDIEQDNLSYDVIAQHVDTVGSHWDRLRVELAPQLAEMAETLSDDQIIMLFAAFERENKEEEEELQEYAERSSEENMERRIKRLVENMESRVGDLSDEQYDIVKSYGVQLQATGQFWIDYRRNTQQAARRLFATRATNPNFVEDLRSLMSQPDDYRDPQYKEAREENRHIWVTMVATLADTLSPKQRGELIDNIDDVIEDVEGFMK